MPDGCANLLRRGRFHDEAATRVFEHKLAPCFVRRDTHVRRHFNLAECLVTRSLRKWERWRHNKEHRHVFEKKMLCCVQQVPLVARHKAHDTAIRTPTTSMPSGRKTAARLRRREDLGHIVDGLATTRTVLSSAEMLSCTRVRGSSA